MESGAGGDGVTRSFADVMYQAQEPRFGFLGGDLEQHISHLADVYVANQINGKKNTKKN